MEKKKIIFYIILFCLIFLWLCIIGQNGISLIYGDINLIDEGQFAAWAYRIINGDLIYSDIYIQYGPLMVFPIVWLMDTFGQSFFIIRFWNTIAISIGLVLAFIIMKALKINKLFITFSLISLIFIPGIHFRQWSGVIVIYLVYLGLQQRLKKVMFIAGLCFSLILFYSLEIAIFSLFVILLYFAYRLIFNKTLELEIKMMSNFIAGILVNAFFIVLLAFKQGWLFSYVKTMIEFSSSISGINLPNGQGLPMIFTTSIDYHPLSLLQIILSKNAIYYWTLLLILVNFSYFLILASCRKIPKLTLAILISVYTLLLYINIVGRSGHYFMIVSFTVILTSYSLSILLKYNIKGVKYGKYLIVFLIIMFLLYIIRHVAIFRYSIIPRLDTSSGYIEKIKPIRISDSQFKKLNQIKNYVDKNLGRNRKIYILNNNPGLYFILERKNATRYDLPLLAGSIDKRYEIVNDIIKNKPDLIIEDLSSWAVDGISDRMRQPEVFEFVEKNYLKTVRIGNYTIYKIR